MRKPGWYGVDLDGTLALYDGWRGPAHVGAPVARMVERVKRLLADGYGVKVLTARVGPGQSDEDVATAFEAIWDWTAEHVGTALEATATKDFAMIACFDDRAFQVVPNTGLVVGEHGGEAL